jgi:hypothetical protein
VVQACLAQARAWPLQKIALPINGDWRMTDMPVAAHDDSWDSRLWLLRLCGSLLSEKLKAEDTRLRRF